MNKTVRNILISLALIAAGVYSVTVAAITDVPIFSRVICISVGIVGVLFSLVMYLAYRLFLNRNKAIIFAVVSAVAGMAGIVLLVNDILGFWEPKYFVLLDLVMMGGVTVAFSAFLRKTNVGFWVSVLIAGIGGIVAGVLALASVQASLLTGCVTASVILIYPLCVAAHKARYNAKGIKIVTVKEKDIEVIDDEEKK